jgi:hypothetical protein
MVSPDMGSFAGYSSHPTQKYIWKPWICLLDLDPRQVEPNKHGYRSDTKVLIKRSFLLIVCVKAREENHEKGCGVFARIHQMREGLSSVPE